MLHTFNQSSDSYTRYKIESDNGNWRCEELPAILGIGRVKSFSVLELVLPQESGLPEAVLRRSSQSRPLSIAITLLRYSAPQSSQTHAAWVLGAQRQVFHLTNYVEKLYYGVGSSVVGMVEVKSICISFDGII